MDLSQDYDSLYDSRGRANLGEASSGKISGKILTESVPYTFVSVKRRNNESRVQGSICRGRGVGGV